MPYRNWNDGQELTFEDFNAGPKALAREVYDRLAYEMLQRKTDAFFGDSFLVEFATATSITVRSGLGFQHDSSQVSPSPVRRPIYNAASFPKSIATPDGSSDRIDIVVVKSILEDELSATRKFKNATTQVVTNENLVVQRDWANEVLIVAGTPAASPVEPAVPAGYIKIATILVEAVNGITVAGNIADNRTLLPLAGTTLHNTTGFVRLTAGAEVSMDTLLADIEAFLVAGLQTYTDYEQKNQAEITAIGNPAAAHHRIYNKDGNFFAKDSTGAETPLGGGAGGGGGLSWDQVPGNAPIAEYEFNNEIFLFEAGAGQVLTTSLKIPQGFIAGKQILMYLAGYSPATANNWTLQLTTTLIRKNDDSFSSVVNQNVIDSGDIVNTISNQYRQLSVGLTDAVGEVNSIVAQPGDILKVELERIAPAGTEDTSDVRFIPTATEVTFS